MLVDLDKQLKIPSFIFCTTSTTPPRPDLVLYSVVSKTVVVVELTCPSEENIEIRHAEKTAKYEDMVAGCRANGWQTNFFAVEVGARGYVAELTRFCLSKLGVRYPKVKNTCKQLSDTALR